MVRTTTAAGIQTQDSDDESINAETDRRIIRRELTQEEITWLLETTLDGPARMCLSGLQRYLLYLTALSTGLRSKELGSLTPGSFVFDADRPTVTIAASDEKARRGAVLPLSLGIATILEPYVAMLPSGERLWPGNWAKNTSASKFFHPDMDAAREQWIEDTDDESERSQLRASKTLLYRVGVEQADFHGQRHTFFSRAGRSGVPAKVMQQLARHSTVQLTLNRYTHTNEADMVLAVNQIQPLPITIKAPRLVAPDKASQCLQECLQGDAGDWAGQTRTKWL